MDAVLPTLPPAQSIYRDHPSNYYKEQTGAQLRDNAVRPIEI
ncbi:hypothetical protein Slin14017_G112740 [Septoria linicola]|nr:hypothetical protein Slin14017_G122370 [Septoria linicola]KAI5358988.1 hypothetical protein Slin14017_G112710 [Septoria linicola]KAI5358991.1 hypothetical protein Slin14017_G112740 [Septoria linicola]